MSTFTFSGLVSFPDTPFRDSRGPLPLSHRSTPSCISFSNSLKRPVALAQLQVSSPFGCKTVRCPTLVNKWCRHHLPTSPTDNFPGRVIRRRHYYWRLFKNEAFPLNSFPPFSLPSAVCTLERSSPITFSTAFPSAMSAQESISFPKRGWLGGIIVVSPFICVGALCSLYLERKDVCVSFSKVFFVYCDSLYPSLSPEWRCLPSPPFSQVLALRSTVPRFFFFSCKCFS